MASSLPPSFGQLLKRYRIAANLTQEALAERAGLSARAISDIERGLRRTPYQDTVGRLADALQLSPEERAQFASAARRHGGGDMSPASGAVAVGNMPGERSLVSPVVNPQDVATHIPAEPASFGGSAIIGAGSRQLPVAPRALPARVTRLVSVLLVGAFLGSALLFAGVAPQPTHKGGGRLCLASEFPLATDKPQAPARSSMEHAVDLAVQRSLPLGSGYTLAVLHYDEASLATTQHDPTQAALNIINMVKTPCILGLVGPRRSSLAMVEMPISAVAGMAMISPSNTNPGLTIRLYAGLYGVDFDQLHPAGANTTYFRTIANDAFQGLVDANFMFKDLAARNAYVVVERSPYGESIASEFTQGFLNKGGEIVGMESLPASNPSVIAHIAARIAAAAPDAVFFGGTTDGGGALLKQQLVQSGYKGPIVGGDGIAGDPAFIEQAGVAAATNSFGVVQTPDLATFKSDAALALIRAYHARYPGESLDGYGVYAYDAAMVLITAIKYLIRTGQEVTRQRVLDQVQRISYVGVTGPISFDRNGDNAHGVFNLYTVRDGVWTWVKPLSA